jgi:hypothetical protein
MKLPTLKYDFMNKTFFLTRAAWRKLRTRGGWGIEYLQTYSTDFYGQRLLELCVLLEIDFHILELLCQLAGLFLSVLNVYITFSMHILSLSCSVTYFSVSCFHGLFPRYFNLFGM